MSSRLAPSPLPRQPGRPSAASGGPRAPALVERTLRSPGNPLDATTRGFMEQRFGHDFSQVRVHADRAARASAEVIGARAYSAGQHVVWARSFAPSTQEDRRLLAHELAHVVQRTENPEGATASIIRRREGDAFPTKGIQVIGPGAADLANILTVCSGIPLQVGADGLLTEDASKTRGTAQSKAATKQLDLMLKDTSTGIIVDTDPHAESVDIGAYSSAFPGYQRIDVANLKVYEAATGAAKGLSACDAALHEITEAFTARKGSIAGSPTGKKLFTKAHKAGSTVEAAVRKNLGRPARSSVDGDVVIMGKEGKNLLALETMYFGKGAGLYTQLSLMRYIPGTATKGEGDSVSVAVDNEVLASHVVKGKLHFTTQLEALETFNKYAGDLGYDPLPIPESLKSEKKK